MVMMAKETGESAGCSTHAYGITAFSLAMNEIFTVPTQRPRQAEHRRQRQSLGPSVDHWRE
jgi:hypothetical protein